MKEIMKRILSILIVFILMINQIPFETVHAKRASDYDGTILINSEEDFLDFVSSCHIDSWSKGKKFTLTKDLDLTGQDFELIPVFEGTLDGDGHTISGFAYYGSGYASGFFRYIGTNGVVKNLTVKGNITPEDQKEYVGGLCGVNSGVISNCRFEGFVNGNSSTGGIAGLNEHSGVIKRCTAAGRVIGYYYTGGLAGKNHGEIYSCTNEALINDNTAWVLESDESGLGWIEDLTSNEKRIYNGVDTGGISGYSDGLISNCTNTAIVGYEHTGYNVGGIAGRQSGKLLNCKNEGTVYGRKDVGGIAGQMEPYIRMTRAESVEEEVTKLHDLVNVMLEHLDETGTTLKGGYQELKKYSDSALEQGNDIAGQLSDFVDDNVDAVNEVGQRIDYVIDELPTVLDETGNAFNSLNAINYDIKKINQDLNVKDSATGTVYDITEYARVGLLSGVGGSLSVDNSSPAKGVKVNLTVSPDNGYAIDTIKAWDHKGNAVGLSKTAENKYSFTMPEENVGISVTFKYEGAYLASSTAGGQVGIKDNGDTITVIVTPSTGYKLSKFTIGEKEISLSSFNDKNEAEIKKSEYPCKGTPLVAHAEFEENDVSYERRSISCLATTGGTVRADRVTAEEGATVTLALTAKTGYRFKKLTVKSANETINLKTVTEGAAYTFTMPKEGVSVLAEYEPVELYITSNLSGRASYVNDGKKVTLTVSPSAGYTLAGNLVVTDHSKKTVLVSRTKSDAFVYEFDVTEEIEPVSVSVLFTVQNEHDTVKKSLDDLSAGATELTGSLTEANAIVKEMQSIVLDGSGNPVSIDNLTEEQKSTLVKDIQELSSILTRAGNAAASMVSAANAIANLSGSYVGSTVDAVNTDINRLTNDLQVTIDALNKASDQTKSISNYLSQKEEVTFAKLGDKFDTSLDALYKDLNGISAAMDKISDDADKYSKLLTDDFRAINDQLNRVLILFLDRLNEMENPEKRKVYEDISEEEINTITTGLVDGCSNHGIVEGDINIGGVAGALSFDEEDPEENAAGTVTVSFGATYLTKCVVNNSKNYGIVRAKKDGAGGIAGYMGMGIANDCQSFGSTESSEGNYVGGICGQSQGIITNSYALCQLKGGRYVGGIAGAGVSIRHCYSMVNLDVTSGNKGAIAGQITQSADDHDVSIADNVSDNYYVGDNNYGIDEISYLGVAEPITYKELLSKENTPKEYWHLTVTFVSKNEILEKQEIPYGTELETLIFPEIPNDEDTYGVWPELSGRTMDGNIVLEAEFVNHVKVLESVEKRDGKAYALLEGTFTNDAMLHTKEVNIDVPENITKGEAYKVYEVTAENVKGETEKHGLRLLNQKDKKITVWQLLEDGSWIQHDYKSRGKYVQITENGLGGTFALVEVGIPMSKKIIFCVLAAALLILLIFLLIKFIKGRKKRKEKRKLRREKRKERKAKRKEKIKSLEKELKPED